MPNLYFLIGSLMTMIATGIFGSLGIIGSLLNFPLSKMESISRNWARWILWATRVKVEIEGLENLPESPIILVGNHQGMFDVLAMMAHFPHPPVFVTKHTLFKVPLFGQAMLAMGHIPVDRSDPQKAISSIQSGTAKLIEKKQNVCFFPEGTRTRNGKLKAFKKGAFMFALESKLPVVPFVLDGSYQALPPKKKKINPGCIKIKILPTIESTKYTLESRDQFMFVTYKAISDGLSDLTEPILDTNSICQPAS